MSKDYSRYDRHLAGLGKRPPTWTPVPSRVRREEWLPVDRAARVLDLGCGYGNFLCELYQQGYLNLEGVDAVPEVAAAASEAAGGKARIWCQDAYAFLEERPSSYDLITLLFLLEHFDRDDGARLLERVRDALRPAGRVVVLVPNMANLAAAFYLYSDLTHRSGHTEISLRQALEAVGFGGVVVRTPSPPPIGWSWRRPWVGTDVRRTTNRALHRMLYWLQGQTPTPSHLGLNLCAYGAKGAEGR